MAVTKKERELTPSERAELIYDLSVRDGILGLNGVVAELRHCKSDTTRTFPIGINWDEWRLAITYTDQIGHIELSRRMGIFWLELTLVGTTREIAPEDHRNVDRLIERLDEEVRRCLGALKIAVFSTSHRVKGRGLTGPGRQAGLHGPQPQPGYRLLLLSMSWPYHLLHEYERVQEE